MDPSWARRRAFDPQSNSVHGDEQPSYTTFPEHRTRYSPQEMRPSSYPYAEADQHRASLNQQPYFNQERDIKGELDESFAGLELNVNNYNGYTGDGESNSNFDRIINTGTDIGRSQRAPAMISPTLTSRFGNSYIFGPYDTFTSSQSSNDAESSLRPCLGYRSGRSSTSLRSPSFTPHNPSAAIHSQHSNSAWETDTSQSADDGDLRPMPDEGSASIQSYNDPQTGIWPQEDSYEQSTPYTTVTDLDYDIGVPQIANIDAAAPFGAQFYPTRGPLFLHEGFGAERTLETVATSFTPPSTGQYSFPRYFSSSIHGQSGVSIIVDNTMDFGIPSAHQLINFDQPIYPLGSGQSSLLSLAPNTTLDNPRLTAESIESMNSLAPAPSPSISAATSTSIVERCPYGGCRAGFTGPSRKDSLRRHKKKHNEDKEKPVCPVCHKVFSRGREDNMKRHVTSKHPEYPLPAPRSVRPKRPAPRRRRP